MAWATAGADWLERAAVGASALCLAHCLALPIVLAAMPALSAVLSIPESIHLWFLAAAIPMASFALVQGRFVHGRSGPLLAGSSGLALMTISALALEGAGAEVPLTVCGSVILATAHVFNWRYRHGCRC